jgi:flagellar basal-body rod modification protein FlgD
MSVTSTTSYVPSASSAANTSTTGGVARKPKQQLGQEDFLQLLTTQLQQQDPLKPMDDTSFIAQMAQFSSLQQMTQLQSGQSQLTAASYIGKNVTVKDSTGQSVTGIVSAVDFSSGTPAVILNNTSYPLANVQRVEAAPAPATAATTTSTNTTTAPASTPTPGA